MDGEWDKVPFDHESVVAREDQIKAEAVTRINSARSFVTLSTSPAEDGVRVTAIMASVVESIDGEDQTDIERIESCLCETLVRMWFDEVPERSEAHGIDMIAMMLDRQQLITNLHAAIATVLGEKGYPVY